ncbi:MAG: MFS transporter [Acidobacteria bacterium]|nr:MAG: MFS transporter [Acidobacteriota bacterium]
MNSSARPEVVLEGAEEAIRQQARRRIAFRILPYLTLLYVIAYLDRVNVGYAALEMVGDLRFGPEVYGFGAGIFFVGYLLLEIPGTILVEKWSARKWIARIMISWGVVAVCTGFVRTPVQFYWVRFLLGVAEAGFFPGIIVYLSHWVRPEDRARALAVFTVAQPISNLIGSPISGLLLGIHWFGLAGWRWLFILEGLPAVFLGIITIFYLTDWPHQASWLSEQERQWIASELEKEMKAKQAEHPINVWHALRHRNVVCLAAAYFFVASSVFGFTFWFPTILKRLSGFSNLLVSTIAALPFAVGLLAMLVVGWSSDRTRERRWHTAVSMLLIGAGLALSLLPHGVFLPLLMFCVAGAGLYSYLPGFWSIPSSFLCGTAAAVSIGLINSIGNLGGFAGPYIVGYLSKATHSFTAGVLYLSVCAVIAAGFVLALPRMERVSKAAAASSE